MRKVLVAATAFALLATSCVSKQKFTDLQAEKNALEKKIEEANKDLAASKVDLDKKGGEITLLNDKVDFLTKAQENCAEILKGGIVTNQQTSTAVNKLISENAQKQEYIDALRKLNSKKDSLNFAVALKIKENLPQGFSDKDIEVKVEGTKVFISIANKILFNSGSYKVSKAADIILSKVSTVISQYPAMDVMVEGHTDNQLVKAGASVKDNWDLSVERSAAVVRELIKKYDIKPERLIAAGRSQYQPIVENNTAANRSRNRRTKIIIMPQLDEFFDILNK